MVKEGRFSRWSRLKQKGGADENEEASVRVDFEQQSVAKPDEGGRIARSGDDVMIAPDPATLPGGNFRRKPVPVMTPLAGVEEGDLRFESPPPEALALLDGNIAPDAALAVPPVDGELGPVDQLGPIDEVECELSADEQTIVDALPALESLTKESDFTPFLADKVPAFIRRRALSVLWRSDPILANLDGMNDYDEDYNIIDTLIDIAKDTNYKVGKGYVDEEEDEDKDLAENEDGIASDSLETNDDELAENLDPQDEQQDEGTADEPEPSPEKNVSIRDVRKPGE